MTRSTLEFTREAVDHGDSKIVVYTLSGSLCGIPPSYELQEEIRQQIADGNNRIVIDLAQVERIDSCGIGILASVMWSASQAGGKMVLAPVPPYVEKLLGIVMLLDRIDHADSEGARSRCSRRFDFRLVHLTGAGI